jgi:hypothetical protein
MTDDRETRVTDDLPERPEPARDLAEEAIYDQDATRPIELLSRDEAVDSPPPLPVTRPRRINTESEWFWPVVNLFGILAVLLVNWLANSIPFNDISTGDVINKSPVWFQPAGWAFAIWGLIYVLLLVFAIFGLLPVGRRNPWLQRISPVLLIANVANIFWLVFWHWEQFEITLVLMAVLLLSLIGIYTILHWRRLDNRQAQRAERIFVWPVFSIYLGWISVAALANLMVFWDRQGWDGGPLSLRMWAVVMLIGGGIVSAAMALLRRDAFYPLVFAFASMAIAVEQWDRSRLVSTVAGVMAVIEALLIVLAVMLAFDRQAMAGAFSRRRNEPEIPLSE